MLIERLNHSLIQMKLRGCQMGFEIHCPHENEGFVHKLDS
jgi:hypothetical protein